MAFKMSSAPAVSAPSVSPEDLDLQLDLQNDRDVQVYLEKVFGIEMVAQVRRMLEDVIKGLLKNRSFFRERDLVRGIQKRCQVENVALKTLENPLFSELIDWSIRQRTLVQLGSTSAFTTPEMMEMEQSMLALAGAQNPVHVLKDEQVQNALKARKGISEEQSIAVLAACCTPSNVIVIEGSAGAGKSFTMKAIKDAHIAAGYNIMGTALSWNAAKVLESSADLGSNNCVALEGLIRRMLASRDSGAEFFQGPTLLIVDEAGMVGTRHVFNLLKEANRSRYPVKVVLTGDSLQVNPVDAGNSLQAIVEYHGTTRIDTIRRQKQESHRLAVRRFSKRQSGKALYPFVHQEAIVWCEDQSAMFNKVIQDYISYRLAYPEKKALILSLRNKDVAALNARLRKAYRKMGLIDSAEVEMMVTDGRESWKSPFSVGDEVVLRANAPDLLKYHITPSLSKVDESEWLPMERGVFNRNAGQIVGIRRAAKPVGSYDFIVDLYGDSPGRVIINSDTFRHTDRAGLPMVHNFATTVYASQGQTVSQVFMIDSPMMEFRLAYVGMSRHEEGVRVYLDETELHERLDRLMGKSAPAISPSHSGRPGEDDELPVVLGRYRRSEMLQTVASAWAKGSENLTATIYEKRARLGEVVEESLEDLSRIVQASADDPVVDFVPEFNVPYPLIDLEKVMDLPDPVSESELVRPSEVESNRQSVPLSVIPLRTRKTAPPTPSTKKFSVTEALKWLKKPLPLSESDTFSNEASNGMSLRQPDAVDPFHVDQAPAVSSEAVITPLSPLSSTRSPSIKVPMLPLPKPVGRVDEAGFIDFTGVPQTKGASGGPSPATLAEMRGIVWDVGRHQEPRILARDHQGAVVARYRLDGRCVVGEGYPPIWLNTKGNAASPITIVPGPKEWFWLAEHSRTRNASHPEKVPHMVWAAKDVDWGLIAKALKGKQVQIVRSKVDEGQLGWALDLQRLLAERWGVKAAIYPKPPSLSNEAPRPRSSSNRP